MINEFNLKVPNESRHIRLRLSVPNIASHQLRQLIIIATGLHSHMDKKSQVTTAESYQKAGFATLQFNFMGHGEQQNKSDGKIENVTMSSSLADLKTVWDYTQRLPEDIDSKHISISANSYGALISLMALEEKLISPDSMVLIAPFSLDKFRPWVLPLHLITKFMPDKVEKILKLPISAAMLTDFLRKHTKGMTKKDLLGHTAVRFFVGSADRISSLTDVQKWCRVFNAHTPADYPFVDNTQANYTVYEGVPHFNIPEQVQRDITTRSINFIRKTLEINTHTR